MHLYNLTLKGPTAVIQAIVGNFSGSRQQEIIASHGTALELLRIDAGTGKLSSVITTNIFGSIRSLAPFRLTGNTKDYAIVGSDSGRIVILEFSKDAGKVIKLHQETYGKTGARRIVPGQFLATDPKGRSVMISAVEKSKLVYILNRDAAANITISSPLEAHRVGSIIHHIVGVDVGFENPMYAALEMDYTESDQDPTGDSARRAEKMLTYYELDLSLNHVVRKWSEPTDNRANLLVQVPGGQIASTGGFEGPSGVLVCCEDHIIYRHMDVVQHRVPIPRRSGAGADRGLIIVAAVMHKMKGAFFFLLQSEVGDLYKVTLDYVDEKVQALKIKYFDTVPVSTSLCILKSGYLFVASEFGNQCLYQFQTLGDNDDEMEYSSSTFPEFGMSDPLTSLQRVYCSPHPLQNLVLSDEIASLNAVMDSKVLNLLPHSEAPQIFAACGRGSRSSFRKWRHGLDVEELVNCDARSSPNGIWATKRTQNDLTDIYIVVSFTNETLVFSIGEDLVEVQDTGFLSSVPSLAVQQLGADSLVQVHSRGVRHVLPNGQVQEWFTPPEKTIVAAATNKQQIAVALSSAEIVYFELDLDDQLNEYQERKAMGSAILALGIGESVGCEDQTVRIFSLDPDRTLENISLQALTSPPSSICMVEVSGTFLSSIHFVHIGLRNGVLLQTILDTSNGQLVDMRSRFLGTRPIRLSSVSMQGTTAILALSSRSWIGRMFNNQTTFTPLIYENLENACSFVHGICSDGFIGTGGSVLRIFRLPKIDDKLHEISTPLSHTPRQIICHPTNKHFYIVESDNRVKDDTSLEAKEHQLGSNETRGAHAPNTFAQPPATSGTWSSCIRILDPIKGETAACVPLGLNEAAFSVAIVPFSARGGESMLVVGTATDVVVMPRSCTAGFLRTYTFKDDGRIKFLHKVGCEYYDPKALTDHPQTEVDDIPLALSSFQGRLVAGVGQALRIYDIGKQKMLCKAENKSFGSIIVTLNTQGSRIVVGDMQQSLTFIGYKPAENRLIVVADDTQQRWTTCATMLDYNTVAAGDRFGNIFINRLDPEISAGVDADPTGAGTLHEKALLNGAPHKSQMIAHFHLGDLPTSIHKIPLVSGAREVILYTGLQGTIGILVPLASKDDIDFLSSLEQHIRMEQGSLSVVDGDLCEMFYQLPGDRQRIISGELDRTVGEVLKKLEQIRVMSSGF
ncbi:CPSF A subunit region-domain-containing protein [Mycena maculata]|uniref:CPSF A subunit region-domain-containing protein n=1 Tax=Mycena maculata TaxID=230809 RepID=A0AAD7MXC4_9AGAR|nr:CPSF A subunit region-domain-containing protein [Mycena maculata]